MQRWIPFVALIVTAGITASLASAHRSPIQNFECPKGQEVVAGINRGFTTHGEVKRKFHADFPKVRAGEKVAVIFSWHGAGRTIKEWRKHFPIERYSSPEFPFIVITPEDTDLKPVGTRKGFAWDIFKSVPGDDNLEAMLFESVLACLLQKHHVSEHHIYSAGFSAGAIVSSMLHSRYPDIVAAVYMGSGAWLNDPQQRDLIHVPFGISIAIQWPDLNPFDHGAVLQSYGSKLDRVRFGFTDILNFHDTGALSEHFLPRNGRTLLSCEHENAHFLHPLLSAEEVARFFSVHRMGQSSPYEKQSDVPRFLSSVCTLQSRT